MSCKNIIMQGDSYPIYFTLKENKEYINIEDIDRIQFVIGELVKMYIKNPQIVDGHEEVSEVTYDAENHQFIFPILQDESFAFESKQESQIRIKYEDGTIIGRRIGKIDLQYSLTEEEI